MDNSDRWTVEDRNNMLMQMGLQMLNRAYQVEELAPHQMSYEAGLTQGQ